MKGGDENSVRGVNVIRVVDGKIVEAFGYARAVRPVSAGRWRRRISSGP